MCDIYQENCEGCGLEIPMHLGDFSVARQHVTVFCDDCEEDFFEYINRSFVRQYNLFIDQDTNGKKVYILTLRPHSIHLNGDIGE